MQASYQLSRQLIQLIQLVMTNLVWMLCGFQRPSPQVQSPPRRTVGPGACCLGWQRDCLAPWRGCWQWQRGWCAGAGHRGQTGRSGWRRQGCGVPHAVRSPGCHYPGWLSSFHCLPCWRSCLWGCLVAWTPGHSAPAAWMVAVLQSQHALQLSMQYL